MKLVVTFELDRPSLGGLLDRDMYTYIHVYINTYIHTYVAITQRTPPYYKYYGIVKHYAVVFLLRPPYLLRCEPLFEGKCL